MTYTECRLEKGGVVVAYLCPTTQTTPVSKNDLFSGIRAHGRGGIVRDVRRWYWEVTVQGTFDHSDNLPEAHRVALQSLFGVSDITPEMQMRRVYQYAFGVGGAFDLITPECDYTATSDEQMTTDPVGNKYDKLRLPRVAIDEIRGPYVAGQSRIEWMLKFISGFARNDEEEE